jgi:N-acetylmuramic acid 6-phosphate (MurNAc-6-P) etherase
MYRRFIYGVFGREITKCTIVHTHIYTVYIRCFWQGNHQLYNRTRRIHTGLANHAHQQSLFLLLASEKAVQAACLLSMLHCTTIFSHEHAHVQLKSSECALAEADQETFPPALV